MITRKSFLIIMAFMNCYMWVLNVVKIKILVDLTSDNMEKLLTGSVEKDHIHCKQSINIGIPCRVCAVVL